MYLLSIFLRQSKKKNPPQDTEFGALQGGDWLVRQRSSVLWFCRAHKRLALRPRSTAVLMMYGVGWNELGPSSHRNLPKKRNKTDQWKESTPEIVTKLSQIDCFDWPVLTRFAPRQMGAVVTKSTRKNKSPTNRDTRKNKIIIIIMLVKIIIPE